MKASISLAEELRAIRKGGNTGMLFKHTAEPEKSEHPWQADIDRMEQTLQEVLQAVSRLSGVELPGIASDSGGSNGSLTRLDFGTLKDRIRNDLEAYSLTTASDLAKQAEEQTRAALGAIQNEVSSQIEQITSEYRQKLQEQVEPGQIEIDVAKQSQDRVVKLIQAQTDEFARWVWLMCKGTGTPIPEQIEKVLEPYVEEATGKLGDVFRQRAQELLVDQEQVIQERLQGTTSSLEDHINGLEQAARQRFEQNADSVAQKSAERLDATADEAAKAFEGKIGERAEGSLNEFQTRLGELEAASCERLGREGDQQAEGFRHRLEGLAAEVEGKSVSEISSRIEQTAANAIESSVQHLHQQAGDSLQHAEEELKVFTDLQMNEIREQVKDLGSSAHESLSQDAERLAESLSRLDQELDSIEKKHISASEEKLSAMIQGTMDSLAVRLQQIADTQVEEISKSTRESQGRAISQYEAQLHEVTEGHCDKLRERIEKEAGEAGARVAAEVKVHSESVMQELSNRVNASASVLREQGIQASSQIESSLKTSLETYRQQLAQITEAGMEEHRNAVAGSITDLHERLRQAADLLVQYDA